MNRALHMAVAAALAMSLSLSAHGFDATEPPILEPGDAKISVAGGAASLDGDWSWTGDASLRIGIIRGVELAGPLAVGLSLFSTEQASGVGFAAGVLDMWFTGDGVFLWMPGVALFAQARVSSGASFKAIVDLVGVEEDHATGEHPGWMRGAGALQIDMGPYLTIALGFSFGRKVFGGEPPDGIDRPGWVGDARFSVGSVRAHPFEDLPLAAVHVGSWVDLIALVRADVNSDDETSDLRMMAGLRVRFFESKEPTADR